MTEPVACVLIPTHTTRHLALCIAGLAHLDPPPRAVVVTCDNDEPAIGALLDEAWPRVQGEIERRTGYAPVLLHAFRPGAGEPRLNQVRNNGLRALDRGGYLREHEPLVVCDGDTVLEPTALGKHARRMAAGADVNICYRIELSEEQTGAMDTSPVQGDRAAYEAFLQRVSTPEARAALAARDRRYRKALWLRRLAPAWTGLAKPHKPKLLGGHHAVRVSALRAVNGFDERFAGYRFNDDDLGRRLYAHRPRLRVDIAVADIVAVHFWHPIRAPQRLQDAPGYQTFAGPWTARAALGWDRPREQAPITVRVVGAERADDDARPRETGVPASREGSVR